MIFLKAVLAKFALVLASVGIALVVLEVGLRFLGPPPASAPLVPDPVFDHVHLRDFAYKAYSPDGQFQSFTVYWDTEGLVADPKNSHEPDVVARPRTIALMGDSFVEAGQVPYAASFAGILNQHAAADTSFLNWGVSSYSPMLYVLLWRNRILPTHPAHVFLLLYENDVNDDTIYSGKAKFDADGFPVSVTGSPEPLVLAWIRRSSLFRTLRYAFLKIQAGHSGTDASRAVNAGNYLEVSPDISPLTARMLLGLKKEVEASGAKFTVLSVPSRRSDILGDPPDSPVPFAARAHAWCRENGIDYIDLEAPFQNSRKSQGNGKLFFAKDIHFTEAAHRIVAAEIEARYPEYFLPEGKEVPAPQPSW